MLIALFIFGVIFWLIGSLMEGAARAKREREERDARWTYRERRWRFWR